MFVVEEAVDAEGDTPEDALGTFVELSVEFLEMLVFEIDDPDEEEGTPVVVVVVLLFCDCLSVAEEMFPRRICE